MCDRSKQISPRLSNIGKKKDDEVMVNQRKVKCMFWMMMILWAICLLLLVIPIQRNYVFFIKASQIYLEIRRVPICFEFCILCKHFE